ncbi:MAG TPA: hypothetical protein ENK23_08315 [Sorangium sp.]|nr:hypothetical protein [Sorangium sp.]
MHYVLLATAFVIALSLTSLVWHFTTRSSAPARRGAFDTSSAAAPPHPSPVAAAPSATEAASLAAAPAASGNTGAPTTSSASGGGAPPTPSAATTHSPPILLRKPLHGAASTTSHAPPTAPGARARPYTALAVKQRLLRKAYRGRATVDELRRLAKICSAQMDNACAHTAQTQLVRRLYRRQQR